MAPQESSGRRALPATGASANIAAMDDPEQRSARPRLGATAQSDAEQRRARQAAALRENLRRRKAQERGRDAPLETGPEPGPENEPDAER